MQKRAIGVSNLPNLIHSQFISKGCTFNIMIAGSRSLGKTTFLNQFLGSKIIQSQPYNDKNENSYWYLENQCNIQTSYL